MEYHEDKLLTYYVWNHYLRFVTEFEWRVNKVIIGREKAAAAKTPSMAETVWTKWSGLNDAEIEVALADGIEAFRRQVRNRILSEHAAEVFINRCPRCACIVRTPLARQCFWCGFDWHAAE